MTLDEMPWRAQLTALTALFSSTKDHWSILRGHDAVMHVKWPDKTTPLGFRVVVLTLANDPRVRTHPAGKDGKPVPIPSPTGRWVTRKTHPWIALECALRGGLPVCAVRLTSEGVRHMTKLLDLNATDPATSDAWTGGTAKS